jgi:hypothetical protein
MPPVHRPSRSHPIRLRPWLGSLLCGLAMVIVLACAAQVARGAALAQPAADDPARQVLSRSIARLALMDLRNVATPSQNDYIIANILLSLAHDMAPQDQDILRKHIEAAYAAGDENLVLELTRRLLDLEPGDTIAQLRLITAAIASQNQTAEERLAAYENFLGPQGRRFAAEIRSRLALDAALLLRERGDQRGFLEKLTLATQLDSTHKEAAALAATVIADSGQGPVATLESLSILLMADPVDPNVHLAMARLLATERAFEPALRFHRNAVVIMQLAGGVPDQVALEQRILQWHVHGPAVVLKQFNDDLLAAQAEAFRTIRMMQEMRHPVAGLPQPEDIRFPLHISLLAAVAAGAAGDDTAAQGLLTDMAQEDARLSAAAEDSVRRGELNAEQAARAIFGISLQLQTARLWAGYYIEDAARDLQERQDALERLEPDAVRLLSGWLALRQGQPEEALSRLEPISERHMLALLGMAIAHEALGNNAHAINLYEQVLRLGPLDALGAWARTRLLALGHREDPRTVAGVTRVARTVPLWVDRLVTRPQEFVQLTVRAVDTAPGPLDQNRVRITIRNMAEVPLALGADRAINSRMLLSPKIDMDGQGMEQLVRPEVIDLDRRLRLGRHEVLTAEVWADPGQTGWITEVLANRTVRLRWRLVQGFLLDQAIGFRSGPMSQTTETEAVLRRPFPETAQSPDALARRIAADPLRSLPGLAAALRTGILQPLIVPTRDDLELVPAEFGRESRVRLRTDRIEALRPAIEALADRYQNLTSIDRALLAAIVPHATMSSIAAPFDQVVRGDPDPLVAAIVLVTRVTDHEDEYLVRAAEHGDERVRTLAAAVAQRLQRDDPIYARMAPQPYDAPAPAAPRGGAAR